MDGDPDTLLHRLEQVRRWTIDFGDRDKVLRVETEQSHPAEITQLVTSAGFACEELVYTGSLRPVVGLSGVLRGEWRPPSGGAGMLFSGVYNDQH